MSSVKKSVLLLVSGSIAAYKAADIASKLVQSGINVTAAMTPSAVEFLGPATLQGITGLPVLTGPFDEPFEGKMAHIHLPQSVDLIVVAPATANLIARYAQGIADDIVTTMLLAATAPVLVAPAMNSIMWGSSATVENVATLTSRGVHFIAPDSGHLACGAEGSGRLANTEDIVRAARKLLYPRQDLLGKVVLISAGATREPIDPVRFISNRSSGKMGFALAEAARDRGAEVIVVKGHTEVEPPDGVEMIPVSTTAEMLEAVKLSLLVADIFISAAAPADFAPVPALQKIKKGTQVGELTLTLNQTPDILHSIEPIRTDKIIVGFAAETENILQNARAKLVEKGLDIIVSNDVSKSEIGFGSDKNEVTILLSDGRVREVAVASKRKIAEEILDEITTLMQNPVK